MAETASGLLALIEQKSPALWAALRNGEAQGLIFIDEKNDALSATNRLLLTFPDLHEMVNQVVDQWTRTHAPDLGQLAAVLDRAAREV